MTEGLRNYDNLDYEQAVYWRKRALDAEAKLLIGQEDNHIAFIVKVAGQEPCKPDAFTPCPQCMKNIEEANAYLPKPVLPGPEAEIVDAEIIDDAGRSE